MDPIDLTVYYADDAQFNCSSQGGPNNRYQWTHLDTGSVVGNDSYLFLNMTMLNDEGTYQCSVSNAAGRENSTGFLNGMLKIVIFYIGVSLNSIHFSYFIQSPSCH